MTAQARPPTPAPAPSPSPMPTPAPTPSPAPSPSPASAPPFGKKALKQLRKFWMQIDLQLMILPGIVFLAVFAYSPMYGILIAFNNYKLTSPILNANWVGLKNFQQFLTNKAFMSALTNTLMINLLNLLIVFPMPIIFALLLNEVKSKGLKRVTQSVSYLPHFLSWVIFGGMFINLLAQDTGAVNAFLLKLGLINEAKLWMGNPNNFYGIAVITSLIKGLGWSAVIYLAAITGVDQELYDAGSIDGAGRFQSMIHITIPSISGVVVIMLIFTVSGLLNSGFDQMFILQNKLNISASEVIDTYVYKVGIREMRFSYATAVGLTRSVVAFILLFIANFTANRITGKGLF